MVVVVVSIGLCLIIDFLFYTGLRVSELINIKLVDYQDGKLQVHGKGNKIRYVFLPPFLLPTLTNAYGLGFQWFPRPHFDFEGIWNKRRVAQRSSDYTDYAYLMMHYYF